MSPVAPADAPPAALRVMIADQHGLIRRGLTVMLNAEPDIEVVGDVSTGWDAIEMARELQPSVVLLDVSMPDLGGLAGVAKILAVSPGTKILVISNEIEPGGAKEAFASGAAGFIGRSSFLLEAPMAVRQLHRGRPFVRETQPWLTQRASVG